MSEDGTKPPENGDDKPPDNIVPFNDGTTPPPTPPPSEDPPKEDDKLKKLGEKLRGHHERASVPAPDDVSLAAPLVYVGRERARPPHRKFIRDLLDAVRTRGLYVRNQDIGTINEQTGQFEVMTPITLLSWVTQTAGVVLYESSKTNLKTGKEEFEDGDMSETQARVFLGSHEVRAKLPRIEHVNFVPMPVYRSKLNERGQPTLELLQPGYDAATRTFTCHTGICLDEKLEGTAAAEYLFDRLKTFEWSGKDEHGRSDRMSVALAAMFTPFCRYLFKGKAPMFLIQSNLEGSGKGSIAKLILLPVFRVVGPSTLDPNDRTELLKHLDTKAASGAEYIFADEMPDGFELRDLHLARWATSGIWEMRPMGQNKEIGKFNIEKIVTVLTGNRVTVNRNIGRRTLIADLFPHQVASERVLPKGTVLLDDEFFSNDENLDKILSCMWACIKLWDELGRPCARHEGKDERPLESFEGWSKIVPGIVFHAGLGRALAPFEAAGSGDDDSRRMKQLVRAILEAHLKDGETWKDQAWVSMREIAAVARKNGLFEEKLQSIDDLVHELNGRKGFKWELVPSKEAVFDDDPPMVEPNEEQKRDQAAHYMDAKIGGDWGKFFRKMAVDSQWFTASNGMVFQFGERGSSKVSKFLLQRVKSK